MASTAFRHPSYPYALTPSQKETETCQGPLKQRVLLVATTLTADLNTPSSLQSVEIDGDRWVCEGALWVRFFPRRVDLTPKCITR
eukprot:2345170-Pyramimonas_sp.AAC.1